MINSKLLNLIFDFNNQAQSLITKIPTLSDDSIGLIPLTSIFKTKHDAINLLFTSLTKELTDLIKLRRITSSSRATSPSSEGLKVLNRLRKSEQKVNQFMSPSKDTSVIEAIKSSKKSTAIRKRAKSPTCSSPKIPEVLQQKKNHNFNFQRNIKSPSGLSKPDKVNNFIKKPHDVTQVLEFKPKPGSKKLSKNMRQVEVISSPKYIKGIKSPQKHVQMSYDAKKFRNNFSGKKQKKLKFYENRHSDKTREDTKEQSINSSFVKMEKKAEKDSEEEMVSLKSHSKSSAKIQSSGEADDIPKPKMFMQDVNVSVPIPKKTDGLLPPENNSEIDAGAHLGQFSQRRTLGGYHRRAKSINDQAMEKQGAKSEASNNSGLEQLEITADHSIDTTDIRSPRTGTKRGTDGPQKFEKSSKRSRYEAIRKKARNMNKEGRGSKSVKPKNRTTLSQKLAKNLDQMEKGNRQFDSMNDEDKAVYILNQYDIDVKEPILDICIFNENIVYGCGEFGLREYNFGEQNVVKSEFSLIDEHVILDIHQDKKGRLIYTNPDDRSIYMIDNDDIIFVSEFIICMIIEEKSKKLN